jgi:ribulose-bisphosphate carboxylase large chain
MFGNVSMMRNVKVESFDLHLYSCNIQRSAFLDVLFTQTIECSDTPDAMCGAKTFGSSPKEFADIIRLMGLGGLDIVKEDHNIGNQKFARFKDRVKACAEAMQEANQKTGFKSLYIPNISGPVTEVLERALYAKEVGAGGVMVIPGLVGLDFIRVLSDDDSFGLPILHHPAFHGTYVHNPIQGFSFGCWYGQIPRLVVQM